MIRKYTNVSEIIFILDNLRREDEQELHCSYGSDWKKITLLNLKDREFLVLYGNDNRGNNVPIAMGGICETDRENSIACVWLLCSSFIYKNRVSLAKNLKEQINEAEKKYKIMYNYIYKSNYEAKHWLGKLGFCFNNPKPEGLYVSDNFEFFYKVSKGK